MIAGDVFSFGHRGYYLLADKTLEDKYAFIKAVSDKTKPETIYTPKYQKLIKAPEYSFMGCWCNEIEDLKDGDIDIDQTIYYIHEGKTVDENTVKAYKFVSFVNPDGQRKVKARDWQDRVFYLDPWHVICLSHAFEDIEGTEFEKCNRCSAVRSPKHKPCNKVSFSKWNDNELSLQQV